MLSPIQMLSETVPQKWLHRFLPNRATVLILVEYDEPQGAYAQRVKYSIHAQRLFGLLTTLSLPSVVSPSRRQFEV